MAKHYFLECCRTVKVPELELLAFCETRWGSMADMIGRILLLEKAVKLFTATADDSNEMPKVQRGQREWRKYMFDTDQWQWLALIHDVLKVYQDLIIMSVSRTNIISRYLLKCSSNFLQISMSLSGRSFHYLNISMTNGWRIWVIRTILSSTLQFLQVSHLSTSIITKQDCLRQT